MKGEAEPRPTENRRAEDGRGWERMGEDGEDGRGWKRIGEDGRGWERISFLIWK